ncbi:amidohydrolase family protein [bacterium 210820-DFI.6.37]|nr:amidohydrolase family protein [bacterium 210820-DFI.6.37]
MEYDLVVKNGDVLCFEPDSLGRRNIGISQGKIKVITTKALRGKASVDAGGKIVLPGFIDFHSHVDGKEFSARCLARQGATTTIGGERSFDGLAIRSIQEKGFLINHGFYVSHSFTLRKAVGISDPYQKATDREIQNMVVLAEKFLESGSFGIHFGLELVPGTSEKEIFALAEVAREYGSIILIHMRKDGFQAIQTLEEIFKVAKATGVAVHILHLMYMVGFKGIMEKALSKIDDAIEEGCNITADTGLYNAFPTCIGSSILDGEWYKKYGETVSIKNLMISSGIYAGEICSQGCYRYLRREFPNTLVTVSVLDEAEIPKALKKDYVFVSTNAADGPHYERIGHPETAGTFPRLIRHYVMEKKVLGLSEAVKKISLLPAKRFGIQNKGNLKEGCDADLVIIDPEKIRDRADFINRGDPNMPPEGISYVLVNGKVILKENQFQGINNAGKMINY